MVPASFCVSCSLIVCAYACARVRICVELFEINSAVYMRVRVRETQPCREHNFSCPTCCARPCCCSKESARLFSPDAGPYQPRALTSSTRGEMGEREKLPVSASPPLAPGSTGDPSASLPRLHLCDPARRASAPLLQSPRAHAACDCGHAPSFPRRLVDAGSLFRARRGTPKRGDAPQHHGQRGPGGHENHETPENHPEQGLDPRQGPHT